MVTTTQEHHVSSGSFTNKGDLGNVWSSTTVRATSHTHDDGIVTKTVLFANLLDLVNQNREILEQTSIRTNEQIACRGKRLTRSDSAIASPQVGNATQADEDCLNAVCERLSNLYLANRSLISSKFSVGISVMTKCWLVVILKLPLWILAISVKQVLTARKSSVNRCWTATGSRSIW